MSALFIYGLFGTACIAALVRPWLGILCFYFFAVLDPGWNWRWAVQRDFPFQFYLALLTVIGWVLTGFRVNSLDRRARAAIAALLVFLALAYWAAVWSIDPPASSYYMNVMWRMVFMAVITTLIVDSPRKAWVILLAIVLAQGYNALQINLDYFQQGTSQYRLGGWAGGTKGDNNGYTIYTLPVLAMSLSLIACGQTLWIRGIGLSVALLQIHQTMLLESRGGMLGAIVLFAIFVYWMPKKPGTTINLLVAAAVASVLAGPPVVAEFASAFSKNEDLDSSAASRFLVWRAGAEITVDYPVLGVGPWAEARLIPLYYAGGLDVDRKRVHNLFLELTCGCGVPATLIYFGFFLIAFWSALSCLRYPRLDEDEPYRQGCALAVVSGLPGYMLASMFSSGALLETSYILAAVGLIVGLQRHSDLEDAPCTLEDPIPN